MCHILYIACHLSLITHMYNVYWSKLHSSLKYCLSLMSFTRRILIWNSSIVPATPYLLSILWYQEWCSVDSVYISSNSSWSSIILSIHSAICLCRYLFLTSYGFAVSVSHQCVLDLELHTENISLHHIAASLLSKMWKLTQNSLLSGVLNLFCSLFFKTGVTLFWFIELKGINMHQQWQWREANTCSVFNS